MKLFVNKLTTLALFTALTITIACQQSSTELSFADSKINSFPFLVDTFEIKTTTMNRTWLKETNYLALFIGKKKDTIFVKYDLMPFSMPVPPPPPPPPMHKSDMDKYYGVMKDYDSEISNSVYKYSLLPRQSNLDIEQYFYDYDSGNRNYLRWDSARIDIFVDTSKTIKNFDWSEFQDSTFSFRAYPVLLTNKSSDTTEIGYGAHIPLIMEAQDKSGLWKPIEKHYRYHCGTGLTSTLLPPNETILTSAPIYTGNFKTNLRLKIGDNYSPIFHGTINLTQFMDNDEN